VLTIIILFVLISHLLSKTLVKILDFEKKSYFFKRLEIHWRFYFFKRLLEILG